MHGVAKWLAAGVLLAFADPSIVLAQPSPKSGEGRARLMLVSDYLVMMRSHQPRDEADRADFLSSLVSPNADRTIDASTQLIERNTADREALAFARVRRAHSYLSRKRAAAAMDDLEKALALTERGKTFILVEIAETEEIRGQRQLAMQHMEQAISLSPRDPYVFFRRGRLLRNANQLDAAIRDFDKVIELVPQRAPAYIQRAEIRRGAGQLDDAVRDFHAGLDRADRQFIQNLQWTLHGARRYPKDPDGIDNPDFRAAVTACVRDPGCRLVQAWSPDTGPDQP
jgi:tetratricopeptide (TPR) repeat protein